MVGDKLWLKVNTASRMETTCDPMRIQCTDSTVQLLATAGGWSYESRGEMVVKGKGTMATYWLLDRVDGL